MSGALGRYFAVSYVLVLVNTAGFLTHAHWMSPLGDAFLLSVFLTYGALYLAPVFLPLLLLARQLRRPALARRVRHPTAIVLVLATLGTTAVHMLLYADGMVFQMFGYHVNGFVWNLMTTDGGIESLGASASTTQTVSLIALGYLALQSCVAVVALRGRWRPLGWLARRNEHPVALTTSAMLGTTLLGCLTFSICEQADYRPVLVEGDRFPFYQALHWSELGRALGFERPDDGLTRAVSKVNELDYPLEPLPPLPASPRFNIVWLVSESFRADVLNPEVMPAAWAFAQGATRFTQHRSGGNGTRMGMFSMFYGLPGNYWFPFLRVRRGPVLLDSLIAADYDLELFTSARFSYPEFDKTLFAAVPGESLHEREPGLEGWENDRLNVSKLLASLDARDPARPFLRFMFFESPHANYDFPDESILEPDYLADFDYATMDPERDMPRIWNRYVNACHHLDSQLARVLEGLDARGLSDDTLVVLTGDHGEEFMEHGRWGHNSEFTEQQIRVPLVIRVPGRAPAVVDRLSSHLDVPATLLALLGVDAAPENYSLGHDLFGPERRADCLVADWDELAVASADSKVVVSMRPSDFRAPRVSGPDDERLTEADARSRLAASRPRLLELLRESGRFRR